MFKGENVPFENCDMPIYNAFNLLLLGVIEIVLFVGKRLFMGGYARTARSARRCLVFITH